MTDASASGSSASVAAQLEEIRERIANAARAAGRRPEEIQLVAVSKEVDAAAVADAFAAGQHDFGENRAQELLNKVAALRGEQIEPTWHFIGRLQRNKVKAVSPHVTLWHSVDRPEIGAEIARHAPGARVLVQVNVSGEQQKGGCEPGAVPALVDALADLGLAVEGLMTVPPLAGDPRPHFAALRDLASRQALPVLSMGMSSDFEAAIGEGSTLVRIGRAVFGPRP
ncbi:MAG: dependent protein [Actinomycetota bacterium]|nr:dependent protein [Actinomycetota bacterium]